MSASASPAELESVHFSEPTPELLASWFEHAFLDPEFDEDGDLVLRIGERRTIVSLDRERSVVAIDLSYRVDAGCDRSACWRRSTERIAATSAPGSCHVAVRSALAEHERRSVRYVVAESDRDAGAVGRFRRAPEW